MPRYIVNVPDNGDRRKFTRGQFLAEFAVTGDSRPKALDLPRPVTARWVAVNEEKHTETFRSAAALFAFFQRLHICRGVIFALSWKGCSVGYSGLYELNRAVREHAVRKGGLNIVRHWLETRSGCRVPLGVDLAALFDYLEIRPVFRGKKAAEKAAAAALSDQSSVPQSPAAIHYV